MKGRFFVIEGLDGSGKATQIRLLTKRLRAKGHTVTVFSFPNYSSAIGGFIRDALRGKHGDFRNINAYYRSFPYAIDQVLMRDKLLAARKKGIVLCDRYVTSNLAFNAALCQSKKRQAFRKFFEDLEYGSFKLPRPDRVIYLSIPVSLSRKRLHKERSGKLDTNEQDAKYQKAVAAEYAYLAKRKEWRTVACREGESPEAIAKKVEDALR
ncbi:MAG TPA: dTMP kinase [Candidatus Paceibacterota bacterium]|nr:dTMP kinase [Candidatus Paceibacterota bacterium]